VENAGGGSNLGICLKRGKISRVRQSRIPPFAANAKDGPPAAPMQIVRRFVNDRDDFLADLFGDSPTLFERKSE